MSHNSTIVVTGGGSGGHVMPAVSLVKELLKRGHAVVMITDKRGLRFWPEELNHVKTYCLKGRSVAGRNMIGILGSLFWLGMGFLQALWILGKLNPALVIGFGGYASLPAALGGLVLRKKIMIHEQNAVLGKVNRLLSRLGAFVATSFMPTKFLTRTTGVVHVGLPVRAEIENLREGPYPSAGRQDDLVILIMGGSQGAQILSDILPKSISALSVDLKKRVKVFQQARPEDVERVQQFYAQHSITASVEPFFKNVSEILAKTHLFIGRAGASTVTEMQIAGRPAIFIPLSRAQDDDQTSNAMVMKNAGAAEIILQKELTVEKLQDVLENLLTSPAKLEKMAANAKQLGITRAAQKLSDIIEKDFL